MLSLECPGSVVILKSSSEAEQGWGPLLGPEVQPCFLAKAWTMEQSWGTCSRAPASPSPLGVLDWVSPDGPGGCTRPSR